MQVAAINLRARRDHFGDRHRSVFSRRRSRRRDSALVRRLLRVMHSIHILSRHTFWRAVDLRGIQTPLGFPLPALVIT